MDETANMRAALIATGRAMREGGLAWGTSGNLSGRLGGGRMLVSATGTALGTLAPEGLVEVRLEDGGWAGAVRPSKEVPLHLGIYRARPDAVVALHSSPPYTTLLACSDEAVPADLFVETMYYLERVAWVDYAHPGSAELGAGVARAAAEAEVILLRNHGVILFDRSAEEALLRLQTLELACRLVVEARAAGIALRRIPAAVACELRESGRYKPRAPLPSCPPDSLPTSP